MNSLKFLEPTPYSNKIRIGPNKDGGYVVYEPLLEHTDVLLTYGVGWDTAFEEHFASLTGKKVLMYDPTMIHKAFIDRKLVWTMVKRMQIKQLIRYITFMRRWRKKMMVLQNQEIYFFNEGLSFRTTHKYDTLKNHITANKIENKQILLKIDIEGNEIDIFKNGDIYESLNNVNQLIIEFHDLKNRLRDIKLIVDNLRSTFEIIHIHGNNFGELFTLYRNDGDLIFPDVIEMTFVRKDNINTLNMEDPYNDEIAPLDFPNNPYKKDYNLVFQ